jgi:hypothetical protein
MKNIEKQKVSLSFSQLKRFVSEAANKPFRASELYKYGFTHDKKDDFSDDGNHFFVYRLSGTDMGVSYLRDGNEIYLSAQVMSDSEAGDAERTLDYEERRKLPGHDKLEKFNGVIDTTITQDGVKELISAMKEYNKALLDAASKVEGTDPEKVNALNDKVLELTRTAFNSCKEELANSIEEISKHTYNKSFDFYIREVFRSLSGIRSAGRKITAGSKSAWDRSRVDNPEKYIEDVNKSISFYTKDFQIYLNKLKQL